MVEYHASFIEPEAVKRVIASRDKAVAVTDDEFKTGVKGIFGRELPGGGKRGDGKIHSVNPEEAIAKAKKAKEQEIVANAQKTNYKTWVDFDLE